MVYTGSSDASLLAVDVGSGKALARKSGAHGAAINRILSTGEHTIASGDDDGKLKIWDSRQADAVTALAPHADYVSDMCLHDRMLLSVSGDGTLAVTDLRNNKVGWCLFVGFVMRGAPRGGGESMAN